MAHTRTPQRRTLTPARGHTIFVRPAQRVTPQEWSLALERRALLAGQTAVIGGVVCEPGSPQADAVLEFLYAPFMEGGAA